MRTDVYVRRLHYGLVLHKVGRRITSSCPSTRVLGHDDVVRRPTPHDDVSITIK